jgi:hypothetical protein
LLLIILIPFCFGCQKDEFDPNNPDVEIFVQQIKDGTYNCYEKGENGENLWLIMPTFSKSHIQALIYLSKDTSHINDFPTNPMSSLPPFPNDRNYYILGECLLWTVEGIRKDTRFGSSAPYLTDTTFSERNNGLNSNIILIVRDLYKEWWNNFKNDGWKDKNPLEGTSYRWH